MRDASLDDFLDGEDGESEAGSAEAASTDDGRPERDGGQGESVDPARPTSMFDPAGGTCESCQTVVERMWRDGDAQVCSDCKEW